jgi:hypothetical protein
MASPKLSKFDLQIMSALWEKGALSIREIHETFPDRERPAYTTIQAALFCSRIDPGKSRPSAYMEGGFESAFQPSK